jgi:hypothetical protein
MFFYGRAHGAHSLAAGVLAVGLRDHRRTMSPYAGLSC